VVGSRLNRSHYNPNSPLCLGAKWWQELLEENLPLVKEYVDDLVTVGAFTTIAVQGNSITLPLLRSL